MIAPIIVVGYLHLDDLDVALEQSEAVYVAPHVETIYGSIEGQRTDHYYIFVTQPDVQNRIHYCRIPVVQLVYHNGIAFAPNYTEELAKVERVRWQVEQQLVGKGYTIRRGIVALPKSLELMDANIGV